MTPTISRNVAAVRPYFESPQRDLIKVVLNAVSLAEVNLAVEILKEALPKPVVLTVLNLREAIAELPRCPLSMAVDFETLAKVRDMRCDANAYSATFESDAGGYDIVLLGQGNLCFDIAVRTETGTHLWLPDRPEDDYVSPDVMDLIMEREGLLKNVVDIVGDMGLPFTPTFYLSLDDWHLEHAERIFADFDRAFRRNPDGYGTGGLAGFGI